MRPRKGPTTDILASQYLSGMTTVELGNKYGMTHMAVNGRLRRYGVTIRPARRRSLADRSNEMQEFARRYHEGCSMAEIANEAGVTHSTVQRALTQLGIKTRPHGLRSVTINIPVDPGVLGYLAGLFDGEGNLQFKSRTSRSVACKIAIYSTTAAVMKWLKDNIGGTVCWGTKRVETKGWKPIGIWEVYRAREVDLLLRAMLPYLIIKRRSAEQAIKLFSDRLQLSPPTITQSSRGLS
jgi:hypothetical protein